MIAFGQLGDSDSSVWVSGPCPLFSTCTSNKLSYLAQAISLPPQLCFSLYSVLVTEISNATRIGGLNGSTVIEPCLTGGEVVEWWLKSGFLSRGELSI